MPIFEVPTQDPMQQLPRALFDEPVPAEPQLTAQAVVAADDKPPIEAEAPVPSDDTPSVPPIPPPTDYTKVPEFRLKIQGGILENLGIKMYTKVGKVLVEFAANAFDSDSPYVDIRFDITDIATEREAVLAKARERIELESKPEAEPGSRKPRRKARVVVDPLPPKIQIVVADAGHGMTATEMAERFLPLNRNRRRTDTGGEEDNFYSEAGKRLVMGRKGIGKLSGFGVAERMVVRSKRKGQPFWTVLDLYSPDLKGVGSISDFRIPHRYEDASPEEIDGHGTTITLSGLRCDAANFSEDEIVEVLNETFYPIKPAEFDIRINGKTAPKPAPAIHYIYPAHLGAGEMVTETVSDPDWGEVSFKYRIQFRKNRLDAAKRGAYIYSKGRLAMAPSMLTLTTGMHNFMAHQYMECIVESDDIDNLNIDVIGTNRSDIIQNSAVVRKLLARIEDRMRDAIRANGAFREVEASKIIDESEETAELRRILAMVSGSQRKNARELAKTFLKSYTVDSEEFKHLTPLIIGAANAGEILIELVKVANSAETVSELAPKLIELREIERADTVKLFRARRRGIVGLQRIARKEAEDYGKGSHDERALHNLLKAQPWLIRPDLTNYVSSDEGMSTVLDRLSKDLGIDNHAKPEDIDPKVRDSDDDDTVEKKKTIRPDLVSLVGNGQNPTHVIVVELKAPGLPMRTEHLGQLRNYMRRVENFLQTMYPREKNRIHVEGVLVGTMPKPDTKREACLQLLYDIEKTQSVEGTWEVIGIGDMLARTERVHGEMLNALSTDEGERRVPAEDAPLPVLAEAASS